MSERIKILYVVPTLDKGGAERFLTDLLVSLDKEQFEPHLLLFKRGGLWLSEIQAKNIPVTILHKKYPFDLVNFWQIFQTIRRLAPQIVHTQLGGDIYGRLAAKLAGVPVILSSEQNVNPDEGWAYNLLKTLASRYGQITVAITEAVRLDAIKRYRLKAAKTVVISNGLDTDKFYQRDFVAKDNTQKLVFGTIGRLSPQKGHSYLIEAFAKLKEEPAECLIAGEGPLRGELEAQILKQGLGDKFKLVGQIDDVPAFLASLDVFVFPSVWEGQGIVLMEAALAGLPIIASAVDGIKEVLGEDTAWLVPAQDAEALASRLKWVLENINSPEVREKTQKLKQQIIARYDIRKITKEYEALYHKLMLETYENTTSK